MQRQHQHQQLFSEHNNRNVSDDQGDEQNSKDENEDDASDHDNDSKSEEVEDMHDDDGDDGYEDEDEDKVEDEDEDKVEIMRVAKFTSGHKKCCKKQNVIK